MFVRRIGRPGLIGAAARTAVIAGTATVTANAINRRQAARAEQSAEAQAYEQQQYAAAPPPASAPAAPPPPSTGLDELGDQLAKLADLRQEGLLSEDEFAAAKHRLLGRSG